MAHTEQWERGRRANIHRWFSQHINIELEPWQLEYICEKLELRSKSSDPEETREFEEGGDNIKYVDLVDEDYEEWKRHHERWVREQNSKAIESELSFGHLVKGEPYRTRTVGWWRNERITWGHHCTFGGEYRGEIIISAVYPKCGNCGVERP